MSRFVTLALLLPIACGSSEDAPPASTEADSAGAAPRVAALSTSREERVRQVGRNVRVSVDPQGVAQTEPSIACNPGRGGNLVVTLNDYRQPGVLQSAGAAYASFDGGRSFRFSGLLPALTRQSGGDYDGAGNTAVACGADGRCHYAAMVYDRGTPRSGISTGSSSDGGLVFSAARTVVADNDATILHDKPWLAVDASGSAHRGRVYLTWSRFRLGAMGEVLSSPIYIVRSTDGGTSWSAPRQLSPAPYDQDQGSVPVVDARGRLYVAYQYYPDASPRSQHVIQWSDDGGETFTAPRRVTDVDELPLPLPGARYRTNSFPALAADAASGALVLVWADYRGGAADVLATASFDRGLTWSTPQRLNDNAASAQHVFPAVACGGGSCGASFYSTRDEATKLSYYYVPLRLRGGRLERGANVRVSEVPVDPAAQFGGQYIGDYTGICMDRQGAHPVWTDTRNVSGAVTHMDVYTALLR